MVMKMKVPKGMHIMPDGSLMKDSAMKMMKKRKAVKLPMMVSKAKMMNGMKMKGMDY
jgi:hypothetical protein